MRIICVGLSYKTADINIREKLAFDDRATQLALADLSKRWPDGEFVILSTCNRIEIYLARPVHGHPREQELSDWLGQFHNVHHSIYAASLYMLDDADAIKHLLTVAAGLESMVPGEDQIVSQIKQAYTIAAKLGCAKTILNEVFQMALHVAKHVRSETTINQGKTSVASIAVDCVAKKFRSLSGKTVLNIGAGKMNQLMLERLCKMGATNIIVANRSISKARELAAGCDGKAIALKNISAHLGHADVILTSTSARRPIISAQMVKMSQRKRNYKPLLIVDIAVPRDVEEDCRQIRNVKLFNIDDLDKLARNSLSRRSKCSKLAMGTIELHVQELLNSINVRAVSPTINALYGRMQMIADEELQAATRKLKSHNDAKDDEVIIRKVLHRTIRRIFHPAARNLRLAAGSDLARVHVSSVRKLFELGE